MPTFKMTKSCGEISSFQYRCDYFSRRVQLQRTLTRKCAPLTDERASLNRADLWGNGEREGPKWRKLLVVLHHPLLFNLLCLSTNCFTKTAGLQLRDRSRWHKYIFWMNCVNLLFCEQPCQVNREPFPLFYNSVICSHVQNKMLGGSKQPITEEIEKTLLWTIVTDKRYSDWLAS